MNLTNIIEYRNVNSHFRLSNFHLISKSNVNSNLLLRLFRFLLIYSLTIPCLLDFSWCSELKHCSNPVIQELLDFTEKFLNIFQF